MFDISKEVPDREICQELKKIGSPQDTTGFYWKTLPPELNKNTSSDDWAILFFPSESEEFIQMHRNLLCKAPTIIELIESLPSRSDYNAEGGYAYLTILKTEDHYAVYYEYFDGYEPSGRIITGVLYETKDKSLANALAKMYIKIKKEGEDGRLHHLQTFENDL